MREALEAGAPVDAPAGSVAADSLAPRRVGELMFPIAQAHVDRVVLVSDDAIRNAQRALWDGVRVLAEPGGAAAFSALHAAHTDRLGMNASASSISGGNTAGCISE